MKKLVVAAVVLVFLLGGLPVFAQNRGNTESDLMYINVSLERIWPHRLGYVVQYRLPGNRVARTYIPIEWFTSGDPRGELVTLRPGNSWPSMSVFFRDGEFSHVRLNIHRSPSHQSWGNIPLTVNIDDRFEGIESIELQF